jgi:hypothetical protein
MSLYYQYIIKHKRKEGDMYMYNIVLSSDELKKKELIDKLKILNGAAIAHRRYGVIK